MENLSEYELERQRNLDENKAKICDIFGFLEPAKAFMKDLAPIAPLSTRPTRHRSVSRDQPDERLYSAREVEYELRRDPTRKYKAMCVVILRRSRRAPRVNYDENSNNGGNALRRATRLTTRDLPSLKRLWSDDDDDYGRPLKNVLGTQSNRRRGPSDSGRGKRLVGRRVYDSRLGTCCHQCRQKTTDVKVKCKRPGCGEMFDVDCLEIRYNDRRTDALRPDWRCPVCQGTCNCSFCRPKKGLPSTGILTHKALKGGFFSVSHYLGDVIVNDDGTWKVAPQAAKFRYREEGDVSEDEEDSDKVDELEDDDAEKVDDSGKDEVKDVDQLADDDEKVDDLGKDEEKDVDQLAEDEDEIDELEEDENVAPVKKTESPKAATKEDTKAENILQARKTDANAATSTITEKSSKVEGKEDKAQVGLKVKFAI